jgi:hypothetical protein
METKTAGEVCREAKPSPAVAKAGRSVCAPGLMALSLYRRPVPERRRIMGFFSWLRNRQRSRCGGNIRSQRSPGKRATFRPQLEALEDRCVPSTLTVTNNLDGPVGSLRAEIKAANSGDTIVFTPSLNGQTIKLGGSELAINKNLDIEGLGAANLTISGGNTSRVFDVSSSSANVTLAGMTITGGNGYSGVSGDTYYNQFGGAILNFGTLTVSNSTISGNSASIGGGISNDGDETLSGCTISGNSASYEGGGIYAANFFDYRGIPYGGTLTVSNSVVLNNVAPVGYGADIFAELYASVYVDGSSIVGVIDSPYWPLW